MNLYRLLHLALFPSLLLLAAGTASAALITSKSVKNGLTEVSSGEEFSYLVQYSNPSTTIAEFFQMKITDVLPSELEYRGFDGTGDVNSVNYDSASHTLTIYFNSPLEDGKTGELEIKARFKVGETPDGAVATNQVILDADNAGAVTSAPVSITARASNRASADKVLLGSSIPLNENVTYRVSARNAHTSGALNLTGVVMTDELPAGAEFVSASGGGFHDPVANTVSWTVGNLNAGQTSTETVTIRFPDTAFVVGDMVVNRLKVSGTPLGGALTTLTDQTSHVIELPSASANFGKGVNGRFVYEGKEADKTWNFSLKNTGNVPLANVSVTDVIPDQVDVNRIRVPRLQGTPSGQNDLVRVFYQTSAGGGWIGLPGNPYDGLSSTWVNVSTLALAAGDYVTAIRWDFGTLPVGYETRNFQIRGTILTVDRSGHPVSSGSIINNTASLSYEDHTGTLQSDTNNANLTVKTIRPVVQLAKSDTPDPVDDGGAVSYTVELENHPLAAQAMVNPVLADLLDAKLVYVPGSMQVLSKPTGAPDPHFEAIDNYNGTGQTLLRWSWTGAHATAYDLGIGDKFRITFDAEVPEGTLYGNIPNRIYLADWGNTAIDPYNNISSASDVNDLDGDSDTGESIYHRTASTRVAGRASMDSIKWVLGQLDADWSRYPDSGDTVPGGLADYRLIVENTGNVPIEDAGILDILPIIGDTGVVDLSTRDTEWIAALAGPVTAPPGVTVYYSRSANPERPEFNNGVVSPENPDWSTTPPATITEARSLFFVFDGVTIQPGQQFELSWPMRAPVGTPTDGRIAWNSFGYLGTRVDTGSQLLPSEPNKVGIKVLPDNNASYGDFVWLDGNQNGIQDSGEPGLNGIRVDLYEDGPIGGFGDGVRDPSTDRHVGFTVTSNDFNGDPGFYLFPNLDRGNYYAVFSIPDTYTVTSSDAGTDDRVDSDVDRQVVDGSYIKGYTPITDLDANEHDRSWDLGLWLPPSSVDIVKTAGTAADGGEHWVLPGTAVTYTYTITNTGDLPLVRIKVADDILGEVGTIAGPLAPGASTTVTKTSPPLSSGVVNIGAVEAHPASPAGSEIPGAPSVTADDPASVMIYASLGDFVWFDANLNGIQDPRESPVPGTVVTLFDADGDALATRTTGANGRYRFNGLLPGTYSVGFEPPAGYVFSDPGTASDPGKDSDANPTSGRTVSINLVAGQQDLTWDAGLWQPASLGDYVWVDGNADGMQDPTESGIAGIKVNLLDGAADPILDTGGNPVTTLTAGDGSYEFTGLRPGSYRVEFVLPSTHIFSPTNADGAGINGPANSDADETSGRTGTVSLTNGEHNPRLDAGLIPANPEIALSKTVDPATFDTDGQLLTYTFTVTNTGNVPLTGVTVTDPLFTVSGGPIDLAVGEVDSSTFTGTYTVGLSELNAGILPNTASVTATDPRTGEVVTDTDDALATAIQLPALSLSKNGTYVAAPGPCNPLGVGNEFNALIFGNLHATGGDTDARLAVGGNTTITSGYSVGFVVRGDPLPLYTGGIRDMFITGGDLIDGNFGVNGNVVHQGMRTGPVRVMPHGNLTRQVVPVTFDSGGNVPSDGSGITFADLRSEMEVRSALLGAFGERGVVSVSETVGGSGIVALDLVGDDPELNIFRLTADQLSLSSAAISLTVPPGSVTLINLTGDTVAIQNVGMTLNGTNPRRVLFNLTEATSVETSGFAWLGSVLAPYANGSFSGGSIDGRAIFGGDVTTVNGFEFHNFPFAGGICFHIEYEFTVANVGNVTLTDIHIDDPVVTVDGGPIQLDPGETDSTTFTATYLLSASDVINGAFTNTATASGQPPAGARVDGSDSDTQTFTIPGIGSGGAAGGGGGAGAAIETPSNGERPDLQVNSVSLSIADPGVTGDTFTAEVEVENKGLWKAEGAILRFWNDKPGAATIGEAGEAEVHLGTLEIGEKRTVTVGGFTAPASEGTYHLRVFADAEGTVEEQSEGNNQLTGAYTVFSPAGSGSASWMKPDFVVQSVQLDPSPTLTAALFDVIVRVTNTGHLAADAGTLALWESSPGYNGLAATPDQQVAVGTVDPGEVIELTFPGIRAPVDQGTYHARVIVDYLDTVDEYSVGNNHGGATYTVFPLRALIEPDPSGMRITWNSAAGYTYYVERSTSLTGGFTDISGPLPANPPENEFIDTSVPAGGTVFYRVWGTK